MKETTLRKILQDDVDRAVELKLVYFNDYERNERLLTTKEFATSMSDGYFRNLNLYGPYELGGRIRRIFLDLPLWLPDDY